MEAKLELAYMVFAVRKPAAWNRLLTDTLGLPANPPAADGSQGWRLDDRWQRLAIVQGEDDDLAALGLGAPDEAALLRQVQRLRERGVAVDEADPARRAARRVQRLFIARDPAGNTIELHCGLAAAAEPFASTVFPGGFRTGALGMGHAALVARDLPAMERFYADALGFGRSERLHTRTGPLEVSALFLHCNRRHHSIALLQLPLRQRMHHFMMQAERLADVGSAYERVQQHKHPLSLQIGQHPDPDGTFSFYAATPSGFDFEIGHGSQEIDPAAWREQPSERTSSWGHQPSRRLQWKMARAVVSQWLGGQ